MQRVSVGMMSSRVTAAARTRWIQVRRSGGMGVKKDFRIEVSSFRFETFRAGDRHFRPYRNKMEFEVMCSKHFLRFRMQEQWQRHYFLVSLFRLDFFSQSLRLKNRKTRSGTRSGMLNICNFINFLKATRKNNNIN